MQYYENGYHPGDPELQPANPARDHSETIPEQVDVLVVGTGPAGAVLSAQLSEFQEISTLIVERNAEPLKLGHADGVACRTVEMFNAFGLADRLMREAYSVNETVFWRPDENERENISRSGRVKDVAEGLSEYPHLIVNQARLQEFLFEKMAKNPSRLAPHYGVELLSVEDTEEGDYPLRAQLRRGGEQGEEFTVQAKYVVGADGARSNVRRSMGIKLEGDAKNHAWGVMDILATTTFPDIRFKAAIQSADGGNILLIPREGGHMVRLYVDLGKLDPTDREARSRFTSDQLIDTARRIMHPYTLDVKEIAWWSVYEVGQRLAGRFDNLTADSPKDAEPRIFIAGDACHTHSAKAGQGMNVSMQDAFNLGWKLAAVLRGQSPQSLLRTYSQERQVIAQELIDFDTKWSKTMSTAPKDPNNPEAGGMDPEEVQAQFVQGGRFTAGFGTQYTKSLLTGGTTHQHLAAGFPVGERFYSSPVTRIADAHQVGLGHTAKADGRWRLYAFADQNTYGASPKFDALMKFLAQHAQSPLNAFTAAGASTDSVFDLKGIFQGSHTGTTVGQLPAVLLPKVGSLQLTDYEKAYCSELLDGQEIFEARSISRENGAMVVVRPDQYVAQVLPLTATAELTEFFSAFMNPALVKI
ncbi:FAD-dependent monooxygenase [Glutamicibacter sp.]|uniref:FAD-dependent monooxygenase n=1 Tax=Glutamicibacter sp. TaxID=1931995 RepID=UPI002B48D5CB|nr:FAD-dependent monooxygenase [Glutamicibacter sp.]HJX78919.1 FAD-dependent monooxygenase [Glutamicibacter sp.]